MSELTVLAVADTDSYLKWSAATLAAMPAGWRTEQVVLANPAMPSPAQILAASGRPVEVLTRRALIRRLRDDRPDVLLLAATGPVVATLAADRLFREPGRPVLVTGLPGISVPANRRALRRRRSCDLFVLHSHREIAEYAALATTLRPSSELYAPRVRFGLATLPFLDHVEPAGGGRDLIFAAQAKVPAERADRDRILLALAEAGHAVLKVRGLGGEQQTHREEHPYPDLLAELERAGRIAPGTVRVVAGRMADVLPSGRGLATVSSTAALEALAAGLPTMILADFGVSAEMINLVFEDSGCLGTLDDLAAARWSAPRTDWLAANYFHDPADNDWLARLAELVALRAAGRLAPLPRVRAAWRKRARRGLRLMLPEPGWRALRALRHARPGSVRPAPAAPLGRPAD